MASYITQGGWRKYAEEDVFNEGCTGDNIAQNGDDRFVGATPYNVIEKAMALFGIEDEQHVVINANETPGRVHLMVYETSEGQPATLYQKHQWKQGKMRLWIATYVINIVMVTYTQTSIDKGSRNYDQ